MTLLPAHQLPQLKTNTSKFDIKNGLRKLKPVFAFISLHIALYLLHLHT